MREEAEKRIGHLYPKIEITPEMAEERPDLKNYVGKKLTVIAWLWARTVKSPNLLLLMLMFLLSHHLCFRQRRVRKLMLSLLLMTAVTVLL